MHIAAVARAFPPHYYDQDTLLAAFRALWGQRHFNLDRLEQLHRNVLVGGRHLALPMEDYAGLTPGARPTTPGSASRRRSARQAVRAPSLGEAGLATDRRRRPVLRHRHRHRHAVDRRPADEPPAASGSRSSGCRSSASAASPARPALRGPPTTCARYPDQVAVLLSVELCSLTLQRDDLSVPNLIASGLFGDGAAAAVRGRQRPAA